MKRFLGLMLALLLVLAATGCAVDQGEPAQTPVETVAPVETASQTPEPTAEPESETFEFTDSAGRTVELPTGIERVAVSGPLAQIALFALCPDKLVGVASEWDDFAAPYIDQKYLELPVLGQLYGGKGEMNVETLLASGAQVVIDIGEPKATVAEDLDALQEQTGIAFVHITATMATMDEAYLKLGELLGMPDEAQTLAEYCRNTYDMVSGIAAGVQKKDLLYITGPEGLNVIAQGSYHAEIIDLLSNNLAVVESPSSKGTGNEVDMEQLLLWNPDVIIFATGSIYQSVGGEENWQTITAIANGAYYEAPCGPYNWMGFPPSAQRYLGMLWMAKLLYPEAAQYDLYEQTATYFNLFYHCELSQAQYDALVANSIGVQAQGAA